LSITVLDLLIKIYYVLNVKCPEILTYCF